MKKTIIFVCHGNICRSPAAEYILKDKLTKVHKLGEYEVISRALSYEEIGNDIYNPMKKCLRDNGIPFSSHFATILDKNDAEMAYLIIYMDKENEYYLKSFSSYQNKIIPIYQYTKNITEIEDPWYSGNYQKVVDEISICIDDLINHL